MTQLIENQQKKPRQILFEEFMNLNPGLVSVYKDGISTRPQKFANWADGKWNELPYVSVRDEIYCMAAEVFPELADIPKLGNTVLHMITASIPRSLDDEWNISTKSIPLKDGNWSISFEKGTMGDIVPTVKDHMMLTRFPVSKAELEKSPDEFKKSKLKGFLEDWLVLEDGKHPPVYDRHTFVQRALGQALAGNPHSLINLWIGMGANGKTQLMRFIKAALGEYCTPMNVEDYIVRSGPPLHKEGLVCLRTVRVALVGELDSPNTRLHGGALKTHSGGDAFKARGMRENSREMVSRAMFIIYGNHDPVIDDSSLGMRRRTRYVGFDYRIPEHEQLLENEMEEIIETEKHLMLFWMVDGLRRLTRENGFGDIDLVLRDTENYWEEEDVLEMALNAVLDKKPGEEISVNEILEEFRQNNWKVPGIKSVRTLTKELRHRGKNLTAKGGPGVVKLFGYCKTEGSGNQSKKTVKEATKEAQVINMNDADRKKAKAAQNKNK